MPKPSIKVRNARYHARNAIEKAQEAATDARTRADNIRNSGHYSPEGVTQYVTGWVNQGKTNSGAALESAERKAKEAREWAENKLHEARIVSAEERAAAAAVLTPVIAAIMASDPRGLIALYQRRAPQSQADRHIIEDAIQAAIDAGLGNMGFAEEWGRTRNALADQVETPEERAAIEDLEAVGGLEDYIAHAKRTVEGDLTTAQTGESDGHTVASETSRFVVASYERSIDEGTIDAPAADVQDVSGVLVS
jgi:hypothetical protein